MVIPNIQNTLYKIIHTYMLFLPSLCMAYTGQTISSLHAKIHTNILQNFSLAVTSFITIYAAFTRKTSLFYYLFLSKCQSLSDLSLCKGLSTTRWRQRGQPDLLSVWWCIIRRSKAVRSVDPNIPNRTVYIGRDYLPITAV